MDLLRLGSMNVSDVGIVDREDVMGTACMIDAQGVREGAVIVVAIADDIVSEVVINSYLFAWKLRAGSWPARRRPLGEHGLEVTCWSYDCGMLTPTGVVLSCFN